MSIKVLYHVMCDVLFIPCDIVCFLPCLQCILKHVEMMATPSFSFQIMEDLVGMDPDICFLILDYTFTCLVFHNVVFIFPFVKHVWILASLTKAQRNLLALTPLINGFVGGLDVLVDLFVSSSILKFPPCNPMSDNTFSIALMDLSDSCFSFIVHAKQMYK